MFGDAMSCGGIRSTDERVQKLEQQVTSLDKSLRDAHEEIRVLQNLVEVQKEEVISFRLGRARAELPQEGMSREGVRHEGNPLLDPGPLKEPDDSEGIVPSYRDLSGETAVQTPKLDRERLCNDLVNTGVTAALVGGFALGNLQNLGTKLQPDGSPASDQRNAQIAVYMLSVLSVHLCTCSALMSAFLYQKANGLHEDVVAVWFQEHEWITSVPFTKFVMGCMCYLASVLFLSFFDLMHVSPIMSYAALAIGVMSVMSVLMTAAYLNRSSRTNSCYLEVAPERKEA